MDQTLPFQFFEDTSTPTACAPRLALLRAELQKRRLDGLIVPRADEFQGEYVPAGSERLAWLTAFTGSAGAAVVLADRAAVFVDGRYTLQVHAQTDTALFEPYDLTGEGPGKWIEENVLGGKLGYDPWLFPPAALERLKKSVAKSGTELVPCDGNPIDAVWADRPAPPTGKIVPHGIALSGEHSQSKRTRIGTDLKKRGAEACVLTMPDSICWLFDIRGSDVPHTPFVLGFAILASDGAAELFVDPARTSEALRAHFGPEVRLRAPEEFVAVLKAFGGKTVLVDPASAPSAVFAALEAGGASVLRGADPCQLPKACKNPVEIEGARKAHIRDGAAMANFLCWLAHEAPKGHLTEISAAERLEAFRKSAGIVDLSFDSISAAGPHAALPHYRPMKSTNRQLIPGEIFLIDSGGQYPDGTTDITRTVIVGAPTLEMKDRFTRVLKSHIALGSARFPEGTYGISLDALARKPLWDAGLDYNHGTGHGIGSYLSVHEGPHSISKRLIGQCLKSGMMVSNEPGYYKEGAFGIRIENLVVVQPLTGDFEEPMLHFETLTLCPIDRVLIDVALLDRKERDWLNAYHARVRESLMVFVADETKPWLIEATEPI
jgi:Xaa-Pro aminopeptidase